MLSALVALPAFASMAVIEPVQPESNPLLACVYYLGTSPQGYWLKPTSPAGGGTIPITLPSGTKVSDLPMAVKVICMAQSTIKDGQWSAPVSGTVFVGIK